MFTRTLSLFLLLALFVLPAAAQEPAKVKASLLAEHTAIHPGQPFKLGLLQDIAPGWHTYWRNSGDSGLATTISWNLPKGFSASDIEWPTPHRQAYGELMNYGYSDKVLLPVTITPPMDIKLGDKITITAHAEWLVCADVCIPESADLSITLPVSELQNTSDAWGLFQQAQSAQPQATIAAQSAKSDANTITLTMDGQWDNFESAEFFPHEPNIIQNNAEQKTVQTDSGLQMTLVRDTVVHNNPARITGDWVIVANGKRQSFAFNADMNARPMDKQIFLPTTALLFAFLGGLILNLMPCVFPVLSMKALALLKKSGHERREIMTSGWVYAAGVISSFWVLALILFLLRSAGQEIGWGIQLQSPVFVTALMAVTFILGLVLSGAITIGSSLVNFGDGLTQKSGYAGTFFTGVLAVVVATPCTAPFMGAAIFYAFTQPLWMTLLVMTALGFGLAMPYLLLTHVPAAFAILPRPGAWMKQFKEFLAFPMYGATIWLCWVLAQQTNTTGLLFALSALFGFAFAGWLWQQSPRPWVRAAVIIVIILSTSAVLRTDGGALPNTEQAAHETFSQTRLLELQDKSQAVFVNMTASWCITCLVNEKIALSQPMVQEYFRTNNIAYLKGDWTKKDPAITRYLESFGRNGVPLYVFYPAGGGCPIVLPQLLTPTGVIDAISQPTATGEC